MLAPHHHEMLRESGLTEEVIRARGYYTCGKKSELKAARGFKATQVQTVTEDKPALVLPVYSVASATTPAFYQIRPDDPRVANGKLVKYETPANTQMVVDIPLASREFLGDPQRALFITEGIKKADAAAVHGLCCVALLGVWNWRGTNEFGGRTALGDWESIALNGRAVYIVFDSDVMFKKAVHAALIRLREFLSHRGAEVRLVYLDPDKKGNKVGLDDFLLTVKHGPAAMALHKLSCTEPKRFEGEEEEEWDPERRQYEFGSKGMLWHKTGDNGKQRITLCNFHARIKADVLLDDGTEERTRAYAIEAVLAEEKHLNGHAHRSFQVPASRFENVSAWASEHLGARAIISPENNVGPRLRHAIQILSGEVDCQTCYTHLGWRKLGGDWVYLHTGGAISAAGVVDGIRAEPQLPTMERYGLPDPPEGEELKTAIRASLRYLDVADRQQTWPILAAIYAAPLAGMLPADFVLWIVGETGSRKSTGVGVALCHFGRFDRSSLPTNFDSTPNQVEGVLFLGKDAPVVIDDYNPASDRKTQEKMDQVAHRLLSSVGDQRGRGRMNADARVTFTKIPRCLAIATAELPPPGAQSRAARAFEVEWIKTAVDLPALAKAQSEDTPLYAAAMAGYLQYLAPRLDQLRRDLPPRIRKEADRMPPSHGRVQDAAAKLYVGAAGFLSYAVEAGAITVEERKQLLSQAHDVFKRCALRTGLHQDERKPARLFVDYLRALLLRGNVYLADRKTGGCPVEGDPGFWGFQPPRDANSEPQPRPGAVKIGWANLGDGEIFLEGTATFEAVVSFSQRAGVPIAGNKRAMGEALQREGLLLRAFEGRWEANVRAEGGKHWCWVVSPTLLQLADDEEDDDAPPPPDEPPYSPAGDAFSGVSGASHAPSPDNARAMETPEQARIDSPSQRGGIGETGGSGGSGGTLRNSPESNSGSRHEKAPPLLVPLSESLEADSNESRIPPPVASSLDTTASTGLEAQNGVTSPTITHGAPVKNGTHGPKTVPASTASTESPHPPTCPAVRVHVFEPNQLPAVLEAVDRAQVIGLDTETTGLNPRKDRLRLLQLATPEAVFTIDTWAVDPRPLWELLRGRTITGHNLRFDLEFLAALGFVPGKCEDTMLHARVLGASGAKTVKGYYSLAQVAQRELGITLPKEEQRSDWSRRELSPSQLEYAARDAGILLPLRDRQREQLHEGGLDQVAEIEGRCLPALAWMSRMGAPFDAETWLRLTEEAEAEACRLQIELDQTAPTAPDQLSLGTTWKWSSPDIVKRVFRLLGHDLKSTSDEDLAALDLPLANLLRAWREQTTRTSRYGRNWLELVENGRIHGDWQQLESRAGRMSCWDPNLQQMPRDKRYRACIAAPPGRAILKADYSQVELRIAARISNDKRMLEAYRNGEDLHTLTARAILGREFVDDAEKKAARQLAKAINFGLLFGMGWESLIGYARANYGVTLAPAQAKRYRGTWFKTYQGIRRWHNSQGRDPIETRTLAGRRRLDVSWYTQKLNSPVQGSGADGLKRALALLWERRGDCPGAFPIIACHDEIVVECDVDQAPQAEAWLRQAMMDGIAPLIHPVPVEVETQLGPTWAG